MGIYMCVWLMPKQRHFSNISQLDKQTNLVCLCLSVYLAFSVCFTLFLSLIFSLSFSPRPSLSVCLPLSLSCLFVLPNCLNSAIASIIICLQIQLQFRFLPVIINYKAIS